MEKGDTYTRLVGVQIGAAAMENRMAVPQKTKNRIAYDPAIPLMGIFQDKTIIQKDTYTPTFIAAVFTIVKTWK